MKHRFLTAILKATVLLGTSSLFALNLTQSPVSEPDSAKQEVQTLPPAPTAIMALPSTSPQPVAKEPTTAEDQSLNDFRQWLKQQQQVAAAKNTTATSPMVEQAFNPFPSPSHATPIRRRIRSPKPLTYEQGLRVMQQSVPPDSPNASPDGDIAFNAMIRKNMPLTPLQIVQLHQQIDMSQRAASIPANIPPKPVSTTIMINLAPGATPPAIRLAQGYVSSLVFVDSTGTPWPIASFDIGNPKAMSIQWDGKSNIMLIQAISPYSDGDMVVRLVGLPTPITLELVAGQRVVDYRVDLHVSGIGPNTKELPIGTNLPGSANQLLLGVLDGVAPAGSKQLDVEGADCEAWLLGENIYFRTRLTVLSPGWIGKMVSPDGMFAYELPKTSSVLVSRYGEPVELKIEGF